MTTTHKFPSLVGELQLFVVVDRVDLDLALRDEKVVVGVGGQTAHVLQALDRAHLHQLEEDVVAALVGLLVGHTGLFQQVHVDKAAGQLAHVVEVDTDELTLD